MIKPLVIGVLIMSTAQVVYSAPTAVAARPTVMSTSRKATELPKPEEYSKKVSVNSPGAAASAMTAYQTHQGFNNAAQALGTNVMALFTLANRNPAILPILQQAADVLSNRSRYANENIEVAEAIATIARYPKNAIKGLDAKQDAAVDKLLYLSTQLSSFDKTNGENGVAVKILVETATNLKQNNLTIGNALEKAASDLLGLKTKAEVDQWMKDLANCKV